MKLSLDAEAAALLLELAGSPRKQGEYVSTLIRLAAKQAGLTEAEEIEQADLATLRQIVGRLRRDLTARIVALEQEVVELHSEKRRRE